MASKIEEFLNYRIACPLCQKELPLYINSSNNKCLQKDNELLFTCAYKHLSYSYSIDIISGQINVSSAHQLSALDYMLILFFYKNCTCKRYSYSSNKILSDNHVIHDPVVYQEQFFLKEWVVISSLKDQETTFLHRSHKFMKIVLPYFPVTSMDDLQLRVDNFMFL